MVASCRPGPCMPSIAAIRPLVLTFPTYRRCRIRQAVKIFFRHRRYAAAVPAGPLRVPVRRAAGVFVIGWRSPAAGEALGPGVEVALLREVGGPPGRRQVAVPRGRVLA